MPQTVLLADKSATIRNAIQLILAKNADFQFTAVPSAEEALALIKAGAPDLLVIDHRLMTTDFAQSGVPVLLLTSPLAEGKPEDFASLPKPFDSKSFIEALKAALKSASPQLAEPEQQVAKTEFQLSISREQIEEMCRQKVEEICWQVVPDLAETMIREEIKRLTQNQTNP